MRERERETERERERETHRERETERERERERERKKREKQKEILVWRYRCWSEVVGGGRHIREILRKNSRSGGSANYSDGSLESVGVIGAGVE